MNSNVDVVANFVSSTENDVYVLKNLNGIAGAAMARYSRSTEGLREVLRREFIQDGLIDSGRADKLIERVLIAYGDDSVGELEGAHVCFERVSNLVTKAIEDHRIGGSPIEKSQRYCPYNEKDFDGRWRYVIPRELDRNVGLKSAYINKMDRIFEIYARVFDMVVEHLKEVKPIQDAEYKIDSTDENRCVTWKDAQLDSKLEKSFLSTYNRDLKTKACDLARCLLPTATMTNVGIFGNGRFYQNLLTDMYSSDLLELSDKAQEAHDALNTVIPRYVSRAKKDCRRIQMANALKMISTEISLQKVERHEGHFYTDDDDVVRVLSDPSDPERALLAEAMYRYVDVMEYAGTSLADLRNACDRLTDQQVSDYYDALASFRAERRDKLARGFEGLYPITIDMVTDWGSYRDLQRHRMMTHQRMKISPYLGFKVYDGLEDVSCVMPLVIEACQISSSLYEALAGDFGSAVAQYAVLMGHRISWIAGMNWRQAAFLTELRSGSQGHVSYRRVAQKIHAQLKQRYPNLASLLKFVNYDDVYWARSESESRQRIKESKLV